MITNAILRVIYYALKLILTPILSLNNVSAESGVGGAINDLTHIFAGINKFLPLTTIFQVFVATIAIESAIALYKLIMWALKRLPTQS